jgi:hypothetical protein
MADRSVIITLRDKQTTGGSIPGSALMGEPFVNLFDGVLKFSGVTGGVYEPSTQAGVFEVGSTLYNQKITNRLSINSNFIISGDTGKISTYAGTSGAGLTGKFLSGTTTGFVIADIADIATSTDSYTTGATWTPNLLRLKLNQGRPDVTVTIDTFNTLTVTGNTSLQSVSASTIISGSTNLYSIFAPFGTISGVETIGQGSNIATGGTAVNPTISVVASPAFNNVTFSGTAIGGAGQFAAVTATSLSATTLSGGTILSGSTNLYSIFAPFGTISGVETIGQGSNIATGGTAVNPTISVVASPAFNNVTVSGTGTINTVNAQIITATAITDSNLTSGQAVYASTGGLLKTSTGFTYDDSVSTLFAQNFNVGSPSLSGSVTIWGDVIMMGAAISAFTSQLYIEDNNIQLNYNPTANTTSTSLGAGWTIQDGSGTAGTDVLFDVRGTATGVANRSFATNLNDLRIRETGTVSAPNGVRVLAENDVLDGGSY